MRWISLVLVGLFLACAVSVARAVDPIPEAQQAAMALKILEAWHGTNSPGPVRKLHAVYFTPSDREPEPRARERLEAIMEDIRAFYRDGMERAGFGPETFDLARDAGGKWILHFVKGKKPESGYDKPDGEKLADECRPVLKAAGISLDRETVLIFSNLGKWDEKARTISHHSPYYGMGTTQTNGLCFAFDTVIQDLDDIPKKSPRLNDDEYGDMSLGKFNTIFIGGIAHELGHALTLPHCGERWDEKARGTSLMGGGNHTYREERRGDGRGTFLAMASAMKLAGRPLFSKTDQDMALEPKLEKAEFQLSTNVTRSDLKNRRATLRVEGTVKGTPPVYGVIAYFNSPFRNSLHDGEYRAPTATSVPDAEGRFAMEVSDLAACTGGQLTIEYCHVNGAISETEAPFQVTKDGTVDLEQWELRKTLEPFVGDVNADGAGAELRKLEGSSAPELAKTVARKLVAALRDEPKSAPAAVPAEVKELALGDAKAQVAEVGWLKPAANCVPRNNQIQAPFLDSGNIYATGLYAHSPSRYVFELGGKWKQLRGEAGLHTLHQPYGSVIFVIKTDGKEVFRSAVIHGAAKAKYEVDLAGVKKLELIVENGAKGNGNDWGLWLDPILAR